jgi:hypothetical protein
MAEAISENLDLMGRDMLCCCSSPEPEGEVAMAKFVLLLPADKRTDQVAEERLWNLFAAPLGAYMRNLKATAYRWPFDFRVAQRTSELLINSNGSGGDCGLIFYGFRGSSFRVTHSEPYRFAHGTKRPKSEV